jgi:hypothetical protein
MHVSTLTKVGFILSVAALTLAYGVAANEFGWFPNFLLRRAAKQAQAVYSSWSPAPPGATPRVYERKGVQTKSADKMQPGHTLLASSWEHSDRWKPGLRLVDSRGQILHEWLFDRSIFQGGPSQRFDPERANIHGSDLLPGGDVVFNLSYVGMARLNACGDVLWTLKKGNHHSIAQAEDGSFWVPGVSRKPRIRSKRYPDGFPGLDDPVWVDRILHIGEDGTLLGKFNVLDLLYANGLERFIVQEHQPEAGTDGPRTRNITHLNDVEPLSPSMADEYPLFEKGDLLVSLRNLHLAFVFNPGSETVKWYASEPFIQQHDPDFTGDGWIGVFDNRDDFVDRGEMLGGSRIVALQPHTDSTEVLFPTRHSDPFYTDVQGKWQILGNGNMLLTESMAGRVVEVAPDGRTVWEWVHEPYENSKVPAVTKASRHDLTVDEVASWACSSEDSIHASAQK